jgi:hypothetical protein
MAEVINLTRTPVQITDGTNSAHVKVTDGFAEYSDASDSPAWIRADNKLTIYSPWVVWLRADTEAKATVMRLAD